MENCPCDAITAFGVLELYLPGCWQILSPNRKETGYSDQTLNFASHSERIQKFVRLTRSPQQQWPPRRTKNGNLSIVFFSRVGLRTYQHPFMILLTFVISGRWVVRLSLWLLCVICKGFRYYLNMRFCGSQIILDALEDRSISCPLGSRTTLPERSGCGLISVPVNLHIFWHYYTGCS